MNTISPEVKTALVTGTDHGVGFSLAKKLLSRGYFVIAVRVDETEKQIDALQSSYPDQMAIVCADIGSDESVLKASNNIKNLTDHIDLLINCAGILGDMSKNLGDDLDFDEISRVINVNAIGTLRVTNALSSLVLNSTEKTIVNISSEAGSIADCWRTGWLAIVCLRPPITCSLLLFTIISKNLAAKSLQFIQVMSLPICAVILTRLQRSRQMFLQKEFYMLFWICLIQLIRAHFIWITLEKNFRGKANIYLSRTKG